MSYTLTPQKLKVVRLETPGNSQAKLQHQPSLKFGLEGTQEVTSSSTPPMRGSTWSTPDRQVSQSVQVPKYRD